MLRADDFPEEGELIIGTVQTVKNYGAFVILDEYENKEGFIHITEVATGWIKYIRDYIRERQKVVCKVLRVDKSKGHVDLSLKQVNEHQRREKIQDWKNEQKAKKLVEITAEKLEKSVDWCYEEFAFDLMEKYGSLYRALEECAINPNVLKEEGFKGEWIDIVTSVALDNIAPPFVKVSGYLDLTCPLPDGIVHIKNALLEAERSEKNKLMVQYVGAPQYRIKVNAPDYKTAEEELKKASERAIMYIQAHDGDGKYYREIKE
ncbi:MAG: translation initiation factor IF-2 subunit alpha [Methanomassiliicoccales archaeon]|nr:MAG: translation initiation factor IF-2 subunit alpha [Methanomassiliicoccales archaeon]